MPVRIMCTRSWIIDSRDHAPGRETATIAASYCGYSGHIASHHDGPMFGVRRGDRDALLAIWDAMCRIEHRLRQQCRACSEDGASRTYRAQGINTLANNSSPDDNIARNTHATEATIQAQPQTRVSHQGGTVSAHRSSIASIAGKRPRTARPPATRDHTAGPRQCRDRRRMTTWRSRSIR